MAIGKRIKELRRALNLTQEQFASRLRITKGFLSNLEKGVRIPSEQLIRLISLEYVVSENWLTTGEGEMFLSPEEIIKKQIDQIGEKAYFKALHNIIDKSDPAILGSAAAAITGSPDLDRMISFLVKLWEVGDEDLKAWARVQFAMAFPTEIEALIEKKRAQSPAIPTLIQKYIGKDINKNDL